MLSDLIHEIYTSMSHNKLRIALTGFSIAWGMFMLIVLLGSGNGLLHGVSDNFNSMSVNTMTLYPGQTSKAFEGWSKGRQIHLDMNDLEFLSSRFPKELGSMSPRVTTSVRASYGQEYESTSLVGFFPNFTEMQECIIMDGRNLNDIDIMERRKVVVMGDETMKRLFSDEESHVGEYVNLYEIPFLIIGRYRTKDKQRNQQLFAPITTVSALYKPDGYFSQITLKLENLNTAEENEAFDRALDIAMAHHKQYDPDDNNALWTWNRYEQFLQIMMVLNGLKYFIWIIGLATLIAGVTGISNIMLITVRERTREFGIRKAIGASPMSIVWLVLLESIGIAMIFGYIGMLLGVGLTSLVNFILEQMAANSGGQGPEIFKNPTVDMSIIIGANCIMILAGLIAGYIPARRAVNIKPIEALSAT